MVSATVLQMSALTDPTLWITALAGGAFGAAIGALPAFIMTGFAVIAGEALGIAGEEVVDSGSAITGAVGFGPIFGPHISFAGGAAAAAYAAKQGYMDDGKNILWAAGTNHIDVLLVGAVFGAIGHAGTSTLNLIGFPTDNIAMLVFISALLHRVVFGYSVIGEVTGSGLFDVGPWERDEDDAPGIWLPWQYKWGNVAMLGAVGGVLGGFIYIGTGSTTLSFGISAASLVFLQAGTDNIPVTHHITLPGSVGALGALPMYGATGALVFGLIFGVFGALMGEVCNRVFYMHGKTHVDPPAFGILMSGLLSAVLTAAGVLGGTFWASLSTFLG